jgi:hypothetical protein
MANCFGVSPQFIDRELSIIISEGRIAAKIDKVSGIIDCIQDEPTVTLYQKSLKQSDVLLAKIHKLARFLDTK